MCYGLLVSRSQKIVLPWGQRLGHPGMKYGVTGVVVRVPAMCQEGFVICHLSLAVHGHGYWKTWLRRLRHSLRLGSGQARRLAGVLPERMELRMALPAKVIFPAPA